MRITDERLAELILAYTAPPYKVPDARAVRPADEYANLLLDLRDARLRLAGAEEMVRIVLRYSSSHQYYDKDGEGLLKRWLESGVTT